MQLIVSNWYQYYATFSVSLCIVASAMHLAWPSPAIPHLLDGSHILTITSDEASWLAVMNLIGSICAGILAGPIINRFGRKRAILFTALPYTGAWLAIAFGNHIAILLTSRFVVGFADAIGFIAVPMYVGEIADASIRGLLGSYVAVAIIIGMLISNALGLYLSISTTALICISVPILMFIMVVTLPESPYFLIIKHREEDAVKSLQRLKHPKMVQGEFERLNVAIAEEMKNRGKFLEIFTVPNYRKSMIIMTTLRCIQQFVGLSAVTFYTDTIFSEMEGTITSEIWVILFYIVKLLMTIASSLIIDRTGRKPLLYISLTGVTLSLLCVGIYGFLERADHLNKSDHEFIPIAALFIYIISYSIGIGPVPVLMLGELIPTSVKSYALCVVTICFSAVGVLTSKLFQITNDAFGLGVPFIAFAVFSFLSILFVMFYMPETKGLTLEEIQDNFKRQHNKQKNINQNGVDVKNLN